MGLALGEAFKQFVPDGDKNIRWDRLPFLVAFLFTIFPFLHGMYQYMHITYVKHPDLALAAVSGGLLFDGVTFMGMAGIFFILSRSLSPNHWFRFYISTLVLLGIDTVWIAVAVYRGSLLWPWLILNLIVASILGSVLTIQRGKTYTDEKITGPTSPPWICAYLLIASTTIDYAWMQNYFFQ
jgi:hypothetical protein